jgi:dTDP-4-amino-4,6-dideoxygalactose transaminase
MALGSMAAISRLSPLAEIPVMRPMLPTADLVLPYLRQIDATRIYSNFGALSQELQSRLAQMFGTGENSVTCTSSGTSALIGAILATAGAGRPSRPLAMIPGLTFPATATAAERCGYDPYLVDVDPKSWLLDPQTLASHPRLHEVGLVIPVAIYGSPVPQEPWLSFMRETSIPVVIDGAASFAFVSKRPSGFMGKVPVALSFHATKSFGVGEGGCVVWSDPESERRLYEALNYGFYGSRLSVTSSSNGKMSEYHAAVGLAELDNWPVKLERFLQVARLYRTEADVDGLGSDLILYPRTDFMYPLFLVVDAVESLRMQDALGRQRIGFRFWYGSGMLSHPHYRNSPHDDLVVCSSLANRLIGLPTATDLTSQQIEIICRTITDTRNAEVRFPHPPKHKHGSRSRSSRYRELLNTG